MSGSKLHQVSKRRLYNIDYKQTTSLLLKYTRASVTGLLQLKQIWIEIAFIQQYIYH